ncbi:peroxiredoxin [Thalassospiraceae bacterium LMO-SO8]|jgi:peroxiredoxin|nr:peroxiredoxin [Alphaproteobacteria bacterium LMO-S08]WND76547.1 peroxiredoxin [Thalassospiraceae bacterium LMO-SO8]
MTIGVGDKIPAATLYQMTGEGPAAISTDDIFNGKKVAIFGVPGAFTPTCSAKHLPGFIAKADEFKAKGIDQIVCMSVNDAFVMGAWAKDQGADDKVLLVGDGSAEFTKAAGLELDLNARGLGLRCQRFAMVVDNGTVKSIEIDAAGAFEKTSAESVLASL